jgi:CheY-like chemotaxis protein
MLLTFGAMTPGLSTVALVVDDDDAVRRVLVALLASRGYTVVEATDGQDAWRQLQCRRVDIVVTDLQMPVCDGRELCRRIRGNPATSHLGLLVITGCTDHAERQSLDCDGLFSKPLSLPDFLDEVDRCCQRLAPI